MAVSTNELTVYFSRMQNRTIRQATWLWPMFDSSWESELQMAYSTKIPRYDETNNQTVNSATRGANWTADETTDISLQTFTLNTAYDQTHKILEEDQRETTVNMLAEQANVDSYKMALHLDGLAMTALRSAPTNTGRDIAPAADNDDAYWKLAEYNKDSTAEAIYKRINAVILKAAKAFMLTSHRDTTQNSGLNIVTTMEVAMSFAHHLVKSGFMHHDMLAGQMLSPGGNAGGFLEFSYLGTRICGTVLAKEYEASSVMYSPITAFLSTALTKARRPPIVQILTPAINQTGPWYALRSRLYAKIMVLNEARIIRADLRVKT